jgi:hypothetical protein
MSSPDADAVAFEPPDEPVVVEQAASITVSKNAASS